MSFKKRPTVTAFLGVFLIVAGASVAVLKSVSGSNSEFTIKQRNPVVNEGNKLKLSVVDANGADVTGANWSSGSPDIASVDPVTGEVRGVEQGFATVTATRGEKSASVFVVVARLRKANGGAVPGDAKSDASGQIYLSHPTQNVILKTASTLNSTPEVIAGARNTRGFRNGTADQSLFAGPTAIAIDNRADGGVYIADTLNHSVRRIRAKQVETLLGTGAPGLPAFDAGGAVGFEKAALKSPRGVAADAGGNLFLADTDNHAVYYLDLRSRTVRLLAGRPGESGNADGPGRTARFSRPAGLALNGDGKILAVADQDNHRVRLLELARDAEGSPTCKVSTVGAARDAASRSDNPTRLDVGTVFDSPRSIAFDGAGNLNVVDKVGPKVVTRPLEPNPEVFPLAQLGVSFEQAVSLSVKGTETFVVDAGAPNPSESLKVITVGAPQILELSRRTAPAEGGAKIVVTGKNFAPESMVTLGDAPALKVKVQSATKISFVVPKQKFAGARTLSVMTRGGTAQTRFDIVPKALSELADGEITTAAGSGVRFAGDGLRADNPLLAMLPAALTIDGAGNIYFTDSACSCVRRLDAETRIVTTAAGNGATFGFSGDGGQATSASLNNPSGVAIDRNGDLVIADTGNNRIRRVDFRTGIIRTIVGTGAFGYNGDDISASKAQLWSPSRIVFDEAGNLLIADTLNHRVRRVDARTGLITTIAGNGISGFDSTIKDDGGPAVNAYLRDPVGMALDSDGNLFFAEQRGFRVRRVDARTKVITTVAGTGTASPDLVDSPAALESRLEATDVAFDKNGDLLIADVLGRNQRIRRVDLRTGGISTVAGVRDFGFGGDGGPATEALLNQPSALTLDSGGNIYLSDTGNARIRKVDAGTGIISTIAGTGAAKLLGDGEPGTSANLYVGDVAVDASGGLLIADGLNVRVRRVDPATGLITTIAGNGNRGFSGDGLSAADTSFQSLDAVAVDKTGNIFVADSGTNRVQRIDAQTKVVTTVAGNGIPSAFFFSVFNPDPVPALESPVTPEELALDQQGNLFITDTATHSVRKLDFKTGLLSVVAGTGKFGFSGDGGPANLATLTYPAGIAVDRSGNLFIADQGNNRIRKVDARTGLISTVAGGGPDMPDGGDGGPAVAARLVNPLDVALDGDGNLFVADTGNERVRRVDARTGVIMTIAGQGKNGSDGDGLPAVRARLYFPSRLAFDGSGNLYVNTLLTVRVMKQAGN